MKRKMRDLKRSGMIDWYESCPSAKEFSSDITVHALYKEFAEWYVTHFEVKGLKNAWAVFRTSGTSSRCDPRASKCWSDLLRLRMFDLTHGNLRFVASKTMQKLHNLVVLQLHSCTNLTVLNLEGLESLRHLKLVKLTKLVTVTLNGSSSTDENVGIYESLQNVLLEDLDSLTHVPDFRSCTSLKSFIFHDCQEVTNLEGIECPHLKALDLSQLVPHQFGRLPNFRSLHTLVQLFIGAESNVDSFNAMWELRTSTMDAHLAHQNPEVHLEQPCFRLLEELLLFMHQLNQLRLSFASHYCNIRLGDEYTTPVWCCGTQPAP